MTNYAGRAAGVCIVGLGLAALAIAAPAEERPLDFGDQAADQLRAATGDRLPIPTFSAEDVSDSREPAAQKAAQQATLKYGQPKPTARRRPEARRQTPTAAP